MKVIRVFVSSIILRDKQPSSFFRNIPLHHKQYPRLKIDVNGCLFFPLVTTAILLLVMTSCGVSSGSNSSIQVSPTQKPTTVPTNAPTISPTQEPTTVPTNAPTISPTQEPATVPTNIPTISPTQDPTTVPTNIPTISPTQDPEAVALTTGQGNTVLNTCAQDHSCGLLIQTGTVGSLNPKPPSVPVSWSVLALTPSGTKMPGITFDKSSGVLTPNHYVDSVRVKRFPEPCLTGYIIISAPALTHGTLKYNIVCDLGLTVSLGNQTEPSFLSGLSLTPNTPSCFPFKWLKILTCIIEFNRTSSYKGDVQWSATTTSGVKLGPTTSGTFSPGKSMVLTVSIISCNGGSGSVNLTLSEDVGYLDTSSFSWNRATC